MLRSNAGQYWWLAALAERLQRLGEEELVGKVINGDGSVEHAVCAVDLRLGVSRMITWRDVRLLDTRGVVLTQGGDYMLLPNPNNQFESNFEALQAACRLKSS